MTCFPWKQAEVKGTRGRRRLGEFVRMDKVEEWEGEGDRLALGDPGPAAEAWLSRSEQDA